MSVFFFIDTSISKHVDVFFDFGFSLEDKRGLTLGELIRPFCIMLLYRYLLHYGLLLRIMSQYLCLFSLILQGLHKEGECRQLGFWARKGANIRDLFYTAPNVLKLHGRCFQNIWKILSARSSPGGHTLPTRVGGAPYPLGAPLPRGPPGGPPVPIFGYMRSFALEKIISRLSGRNSTATR